MKATGEFKKFDVFQEGWYRFAKFQCGTGLSLAKGASGNSVVFSIKFAFNNSNNMSALGVLNSSYQMSNINILGSSISSQTISKLRHVIDESNNNAYLEFYYNSGAFNAVAIELINTLDTNIKWTIMDKLEPTQEAVENVVVYSTADLVTKNRNVVINSDLKVQDVVVSQINDEHLTCSLMYCIKAGICYVTAYWMDISTVSSQVLLSDKLPNPKISTFASLTDHNNGDNLGLIYIDEGTTTLYCRAKKTGTGFSSFSYPIA